MHPEQATQVCATLGVDNMDGLLYRMGCSYALQEASDAKLKGRYNTPRYSSQAKGTSRELLGLTETKLASLSGFTGYKEVI